MNQKNEGTISTLIAFLVLFGALLAPLATAVISIVVLVALGIHKALSSEK